MLTHAVARTALGDVEGWTAEFLQIGASTPWEGREMGNGERSDRRTDWRVRLATMVGTGAGAALALLWHPDLGSFWLGLVAFVALLAAGGLLGRLAGSFMFRQASASSPRI